MKDIEYELDPTNGIEENKIEQIMQIHYKYGNLESGDIKKDKVLLALIKSYSLGQFHMKQRAVQLAKESMDELIGLVEKEGGSIHSMQSLQAHALSALKEM